VSRIATCAVLAAGLACAAVGLAGLRAAEPSPGSAELLYLPNGRHLRLASSGHASLAADAVYLWAIQYYSNYERSDRNQYVEHVFGTVIPELDPRFVDAYALGGMILAIEARDLDAALRVFDRGIRENPADWLLPYTAAWECYFAGRPALASRYLDEAVAKPGAPSLIARNRAGMVERAGDPRAAWRLWKELSEDPASDETTRAVARGRIADLQQRIDLEDLRAAIASYRAAHGRNPRALDVLVADGLLPAIPAAPDGTGYRYEPDTGEVGAGATRVLGDR